MLSMYAEPFVHPLRYCVCMICYIFGELADAYPITCNGAVQLKIKGGTIVQFSPHTPKKV